MHYMVGTEILVSETRMPNVGNGPQPLNVHQRQVKNKNKFFEPGVSYALYNIRPVKDTGEFEYTFMRQDGQYVKYLFDSVRSAELVIAQARGEDLPPPVSF